MTDPDRDEFYVGYLPRAPRGIAARVRGVVIVLLLLAPLLALALAGSQQPFSPGVFEFGVEREFEGWISVQPYPMLLVPRPGEADGQPAWSPYYLVDEVKFGALRHVAGLDGRRVALRGSLIYRDGQTMIQVATGSVRPLDEARAALWPRREAPQSRTLVGRIVDSKCFLGVMKPGDLKPHRSCASLCIRGGIPPVFVVRDGRGRATYYLLVSPDGAAVNAQVLDYVAEPVEITGSVSRWGDLLVLQADPSTIRRL